MELLTQAETCKLLKISPRSLRRLRQQGKVRTTRIGRLIRFHLDDLVSFVNENTWPKRKARI